MIKNYLITSFIYTCLQLLSLGYRILISIILRNLSNVESSNFITIKQSIPDFKHIDIEWKKLDLKLPDFTHINIKKKENKELIQKFDCY